MLPNKRTLSCRWNALREFYHWLWLAWYAIKVIIIFLHIIKPDYNNGKKEEVLKEKRKKNLLILNRQTYSQSHCSQVPLRSFKFHRSGLKHCISSFLQHLRLQPSTVIMEHYEKYTKLLIIQLRRKKPQKRTSEKKQSAQLKYETVLQKVLSENRWWIYTYSTYIDIVSEAIWVAAPITRLEVAAAVSELWWAVRHKPLINEQTELKETCNIYQRFILFSLSISHSLSFSFSLVLLQSKG